MLFAICKRILDSFRPVGGRLCKKSAARQDMARQESAPPQKKMVLFKLFLTLSIHKYFI